MQGPGVRRHGARVEFTLGLCGLDLGAFSGFLGVLEGGGHSRVLVEHVADLSAAGLGQMQLVGGVETEVGTDRP